jgi:hypothetical protein
VRSASGDDGRKLFQCGAQRARIKGPRCNEPVRKSQYSPMKMTYEKLVNWLLRDAPPFSRGTESLSSIIMFSAPTIRRIFTMDTSGAFCSAVIPYWNNGLTEREESNRFRSHYLFMLWWLWRFFYHIKRSRLSFTLQHIYSYRRVCSYITDRNTSIFRFLFLVLCDFGVCRGSYCSSNAFYLTSFNLSVLNPYFIRISMPFSQL